MSDHNETGEKNNRSNGLPIGMCIGIAIGTAIGAATHNLGTWPLHWVIKNRKITKKVRLISSRNPALSFVN